MSKYIKRGHILAEIDYAAGLPCGSPIAAYEIAKAIIEDAPTIEVPKWIPCSERLPKLGEKVLVSTRKTCFVQVYKGIYSEPTRWAWEHRSIKEIIAWMPLPQPYKETDHE